MPAQRTHQAIVYIAPEGPLDVQYTHFMDISEWARRRDELLDGECWCGKSYEPDDSFCSICGCRLIALVDQLHARDVAMDCYREGRRNDVFLLAAFVLRHILHGPSRRQNGPFPSREMVEDVILGLARHDNSGKVPNLAGDARQYLFEALEALWGADHVRPRPSP